MYFSMWSPHMNTLMFSPRPSPRPVLVEAFHLVDRGYHGRLVAGQELQMSDRANVQTWYSDDEKRS